jgi:hypothetical protein
VEDWSSGAGYNKLNYLVYEMFVSQTASSINYSVEGRKEVLDLDVSTICSRLSHGPRLEPAAVGPGRHHCLTIL